MITKEGTVTITRDGGIVATDFHFEGCASLTVASWETYDWIEKQITQAKLEESRPRFALCRPLEACSEGTVNDVQCGAGVPPLQGADGGRNDGGAR